MGKQSDKYTRTFRHIYWENTNCNFTATDRHHNQMFQN